LIISRPRLLLENLFKDISSGIISLNDWFLQKIRENVITELKLFTFSAYSFFANSNAQSS
jgi:hypothetical protein